MKNSWIIKNAEKWKAYHKKWRENNRDKILSYNQKRKGYYQKWLEKNEDKVKSRQREWYIKNKERLSIKNREYNKNNQEIIRKIINRYRKQHSDRYSAGRKLRYAVNSGKIKRLPCEICGELKSQAHHEDYSKPLIIQWLCSTHHGIADRKRRLQNKKLYERKNYKTI